MTKQEYRELTDIKNFLNKLFSTRGGIHYYSAFSTVMDNLALDYYFKYKGMNLKVQGFNIYGEIEKIYPVMGFKFNMSSLRCLLINPYSYKNDLDELDCMVLVTGKIY